MLLYVITYKFIELSRFGKLLQTIPRLAHEINNWPYRLSIYQGAHEYRLFVLLHDRAGTPIKTSGQCLRSVVPPTG